MSELCVVSSEIERSFRETVEQYSSILAGYVFGSACTQHYGPLSDIDVALLIEPSAASEGVCGKVQDALCRKLKTDRIDLISLLKAPSSLAYHVIRDGKCICCRDEKARENFESLTVMKYLDFLPIRNMAFQISRARTLGGV